MGRDPIRSSSVQVPELNLGQEQLQTAQVRALGARYQADIRTPGEGAWVSDPLVLQRTRRAGRAQACQNSGRRSAAESVAEPGCRVRSMWAARDPHR